jgi:hypothetical protein
MNVMRPFILAAVLSAAVATPAFAGSYYIVHSTSTQSCSVMQQRPSSTSLQIVGDNAGYASQSAAQSALKSLPSCK